MTRLASIVAVAALLSCSACTSTWYPYRFSPAPLEVSLASPNDAQAQGRALVTVLGIRRPAEGRPASVDARMRLENFGDKAMTFVADSPRLVTAGLEAFEPAEPSGLDERALAKGEHAVFELRFPLPRGKDHDDLNLQGLNLKFAVDFEGERVTTGVTFERVVSPYRGYPYGYYDDPFWGGPSTHVHVGLGVGFTTED